MATVIDWLATRPWSLGTVGMYGYSYSGFNRIQIAMERPPALKAIIPIYATDDRYGDDVHYQGGVVKQLDLIDYPSYMVASNALPPAPPIYGEGWREEWARRLEGTEPWVLTWLEHQRLDDYWKHGSLCVDYEAIACPTMIVAGWADGYRNNSFRTFERLTLPEAARLRPVGARGDRHVAARTEPRPAARAHPVVGPMAEGRRQRHRPRAADRAVRAALDPAGARPPRRQRRVAVRADLAARTAAARDVVARRRDGEPPRRRPRRARRARRRRVDRVDLVRRRAAVGPARRPAPRRAPLPHVHVGAVRAGVRDPRARRGCGCASPRASRSPTCRRSSATSSPTAPRRSSRATC